MMLTLIRGLPGSGKSTLARRIRATGVTHWETDMYFMVGKQYRFNKLKLAKAHRWCMNRVRESMKRGESCVVSNTFVQLWEMQFFLDIAKEFGADVRVLCCRGSYGSSHYIEPETLERNIARWEPFDGRNLSMSKDIFTAIVSGLERIHDNTGKGTGKTYADIKSKAVAREALRLINLINRHVHNDRIKIGSHYVTTAELNKLIIDRIPKEQFSDIIGGINGHLDGQKISKYIKRLQEYEKLSGNRVKDGKVYDSRGVFQCKYTEALAKDYKRLAREAAEELEFETRAS
jgi:hypothetical protein